MKSKIALLFLFLLVLSTNIEAQFNVKVGYNVAYMPADNLNKIIEQFNLANADIIDRDMESFHFVSGIEIGLRYRINRTAFEFSFDNMNRRKEALGELMDGSLFEERLYYTQQGLNASIETRFDRYGWGLGVLRRTQKLRTNIATSDEKRDILSMSSFALKTYLIFNFGGTETLSFELKPFVIYPLGITNLTALKDEWTLEPSIYQEERFLTFGISIAFYNGPQY